MSLDTVHLNHCAARLITTDLAQVKYLNQHLISAVHDGVHSPLPSVVGKIDKDLARKSALVLE